MYGLCCPRDPAVAGLSANLLVTNHPFPSPYMAAWGPLPLPPLDQVRTALPLYTEQCALRLTCSATSGIEKTGDHLIKIGQTKQRTAAPEAGDAAQLLLALARLLLEEIKLLSYSWSLSGFQVDHGVGQATQLLLMPVMLFSIQPHLKVVKLLSCS
jgi:hypothetical protein